MMADSPIPLTFQCYLGLSVWEEMAVFSVINGKAKGLSSSLLDYHTTKLNPSYRHTQPELYIAKRLNEDKMSVWRGTVKLGGANTQGSHRRVSLRGLQSATKLLLKGCSLGAANISVEQKYVVVRDYWTAVASVWKDAWESPRSHLITKGVGVTALSLLAGDILNACLLNGQLPSAKDFEELLRPLHRVDWSNNGAFKGFGGRHGAAEAHENLRARLSAPLRVRALAR
jgi:DGQHR domain-containing protein